MRLDAQGLGWCAQGRRIVSGVDLALTPGEVFGLIGPNGSGKSTLFNCILGQYPPTSGEVFINGEHITASPSDVLPMAQRYFLF